MVRSWGSKNKVGHVVVNLCTYMSRWLPIGKALRTSVLHLYRKVSSNKPWASSMQVMPSDCPARSCTARRSLLQHLENVLLPLIPPPKSSPLFYLHKWRIPLSSQETLLGPPPPLLKSPPLLYLHTWRIPLSSHSKVFNPPSLGIKPFPPRAGTMLSMQNVPSTGRDLWRRVHGPQGLSQGCNWSVGA